MKKNIIISLIVFLPLLSCNNPNNPSYNLLIRNWVNECYINGQCQYAEEYRYNEDSLQIAIKSRDPISEDANLEMGDEINYFYLLKEIIWDADNTSGIVYLQCIESFDKNLVGKYQAIAFKNLTETTVSFDKAYNHREANPYAETLEEAKQKFSRENENIYFTTYENFYAN